MERRLYSAAHSIIQEVKKWLKHKITEHLSITASDHKIFQPQQDGNYCPIRAALCNETAFTS
jgi:hypothetical protein